MAGPFVQLPLVQMVDLAISPTEGAVNFHLLQALLHALIQKTHGQTLAVEIHGAEATKLQEQLKTAPPKQTFTIKETTDKSAQGKDQEIYVMQAETAYQGTSSVSKEKIDKIEAELNDIKKEICELRDLPGNLGIINAVKNYDEKTSTVIDVFHMMALLKRIEAAEEGMVKMASIVEDLIKSPTGLSLDTKNVICQKEQGGEDGKTALGSGTPSTVDGTDTKKSTWASKLGSKFSLSGDLESIVRQMSRDIEEIQVFLKLKKKKSVETISGGAMGEEEEVHTFGIEPEGMTEERFKELAEHVQRIDLVLNDEVSRLHHQFTDLEKDFNDLLNKMEQGRGGPGDPNSCCSVVNQRLEQLESDFADVNEASGKLMVDKEEKTKMMDYVVEQIELLKTVKADREDLEGALADKADACVVLRKVSNDKFDNACEELSKGIGEALDKLSQQETLWQQTLDDIQSEIGNKLDKMDLAPLREFINNKLKVLQDKMKSLVAMRREQDAAGTKNKILRDVTCISCDKEVVMHKDFDLTMRPMPAMIPPTKSMAPYLAYELDNLRKQQKSLPGGKNLQSFEAAMQGRAQKNTDDHICNRYCGGSHTITTPHQRVTRIGHFLTQWGPEAQPVAGLEKKISSQQIPALSKEPRISEKSDSKRNSKAKIEEIKKADSKSKSLIEKRNSIGSQGSSTKVTSKSKTKPSGPSGPSGPTGPTESSGKAGTTGGKAEAHSGAEEGEATEASEMATAHEADMTEQDATVTITPALATGTATGTVTASASATVTGTATAN